MAEELYATLKTNHGDIVVQLFPNHAPKTVSNFIELAEGAKEWTDPETGEKTTAQLYDGTVFHRVIGGFMIQGGDPLGTGTGGPGYQFGDEFHPELQFDRPYLLAMANAGPGTNGSQFFITVGPTPHLNRQHTIFGEVADGASRAVVDRSPPCRPGRWTARSTTSSSSRSSSSAATPEPCRTRAAGDDDDPARGAGARRPTRRLLPPPGPRGARPLHALRPADLPGLHDRGLGRVPVPGVRAGGQQERPRRRGPSSAAASPTTPAGSARCSSASTWWCSSCSRPSPASRPASSTSGPSPPRLEQQIGVATGEYYRLLTSAFLHGSLLHIALNMYALYLFGPPVEAALGRVRFPALYLLSALGGSAASYAFATRATRRSAPRARSSACSAPSSCVNRKLGRDTSGLLVLLAINFAFGFMRRTSTGGRTSAA